MAEDANEDSTRDALLSSIRAAAQSRQRPTTSAFVGATAASAPVAGGRPGVVRGAKPLTLADEMREKLLRRQKALSGEQDEEEQEAARAALALNAPRKRSGSRGGSSSTSDSDLSGVAAPAPGAPLGGGKAPPRALAAARGAKRGGPPQPPNVPAAAASAGPGGAADLQDVLRTQMAGMDALLGGVQAKRRAPPSETGSEWDS